MTRWAAFAGIATAVTLLLLGLAHLSSSALRTPPPTERDLRRLDSLPDGADHLDAGTVPAPAPASPSMTTPELLANVLVSHGLFGLGLLAAAWYARVPATAFGWGPSPGALAAGLGLGAALALANALATAVAGRLGYDPATDLRALLAPESAAGWGLLLGVVLPLVAGFEELLFRGVLVGAFSAGLGLPVWPLAAVSSVGFALAHGAQGRAGMVVTGALGLALAAGFVVTGSLLAVVVAHYLVNAVELIVHEWQGGSLADLVSPP